MSEIKPHRNVCCQAITITEQPMLLECNGVLEITNNGIAVVSDYTFCNLVLDKPVAKFELIVEVPGLPHVKYTMPGQLYGLAQVHEDIYLYKNTLYRKHTSKQYYHDSDKMYTAVQYEDLMVSCYESATSLKERIPVYMFSVLPICSFRASPSWEQACSPAMMPTEQQAADHRVLKYWWANVLTGTTHKTEALRVALEHIRLGTPSYSLGLLDNGILLMAPQFDPVVLYQKNGFVIAISVTKATMESCTTSKTSIFAKMIQTWFCIPLEHLDKLHIWYVDGMMCHDLLLPTKK